MSYLLVGVGGIIGSLLRYYVGLFTHSWWPYNFPLGTLLINLLGCFILEWFTYRIIKIELFHPYILSGVSTGLIGSFTTFSSFSVETVTLINHHLWELALLYVLLSLFGGLFMTWMGHRVGEKGARKFQGKKVKTS
ncbi:fluoride efflux transporter CrcB [Priestia filamentosa]|uniref:fluoride efflux transporter CrcB n=1 Tax=Priestia filamentosa TaxID=1402861 RepID=UPI002E1D7865|nr:fluoride efflux transporter CrcB [Priestia filamentosa]